MKILIFNKQNLELKDELDITSDYQITLDIVINQSSYFTTNATSTKGEVGDIVILHERSFFFIGVVTLIELVETNQLKITAIDFISALNFEIRVRNYTGNIGEELLNYISEEYLTNTDSLQNRPFLTLVNVADTEGEIKGQDDKITKFSDLYASIYKEHKVRLIARLRIVGGDITHLKIEARDVSKETILSSNFPMIRGLTVSENNTTPVNKITLLPSVKNTINLTSETFYLLSDGSVSDDGDSPLRIEDVVEKKLIYKDSDLTGKVYSHKFASGQIKTSSGNVTLSEVTWYQSGATYIGFDGTTTARGVQIGSGPNPQQAPFVLSTPITNLESSAKVTEVKVTLAAVSATSEYKIRVGNISGEFKKIESSSNKTYTTGRINETAGDIAISLKAESGAVYISNIEVSYQPVEGNGQTLRSMASDELLKEDFMHSITFSIQKDNSVFVPMENIELGDKIDFIYKGKSISTILTKIVMSGTLSDYQVTLGEERSKLTEKLKIILEGK